MLNVIRGDNQGEEAEGKTLGTDGRAEESRRREAVAVRGSGGTVSALIASPQDADLRGAAAAPR